MQKLVFSQRWPIAFALVMIILGLHQAFGSETGPPPQENLKLHSFKIVGNKMVKTGEIKKDLSE